MSPATVYVEFFRGVPLVMVIFWFWFIIPVLVGKSLPEYGVALTAFVIFEAAYLGEIVSAGIQSVPRGQAKAATATGLSRAQTMRHVILPQALRNMIPALVTQSIVLLKDTSLASIIGYVDLTKAAQIVNNREIRPFELYLFIAVIYWLCSYGMSRYAGALSGGWRSTRHSCAPPQELSGIRLTVLSDCVKLSVKDASVIRQEIEKLRFRVTCSSSKTLPIDQILSMDEMIVAIEDALKEMALGRGFDLPRRRIHHPNRMIFGLLPGSVHGVMGAYLQTDLDRRIHHETVILYSVETGEPLILFQDCSINEFRTGAAGAIGAKYLAGKTPAGLRFSEARSMRRRSSKQLAAVRTLTARGSLQSQRKFIVAPSPRK